MKYKNVVDGIFIERPNRFIAKVKTNGKIETVHVKNTGRCKEILKENTKVYLEQSETPSRKTKYDLISVFKKKDDGKETLINIDSQVVNDVAEEWINTSGFFSENVSYKREVTYGDSRFDYYIIDNNEKIFLEVKGVTLEQNGIASFPDAPTIRGIKHINELCKCKKEGYRAIILFIIQMKGITKFTPNKEIHKDFASALKNAKESGVEIISVDCVVTKDEIIYDDFVPIEI